MKIAIVTAGGAGMFCGSCMQDNTMARVLRSVGHDAVLLPTYTPIRVDEENLSGDRVFLGGVNVYLDSALPGWRYLPRWMTRAVDHPSLIRLLTKLSPSTDASKLGSLTVDMLRGSAGPQSREIEEFVTFLCRDLQPDVVIFSNALISGVIPRLRQQFHGRILCALQGDDVFLEELPEKWKRLAVAQATVNCGDIDGFLTHSRYYSEFMASYLSLPIDKFHQIPLTVEPAPPEMETAARTGRFHIGHFARLCPEKGVHTLLEAAEKLLPIHPEVDVTIAGFLPRQHRRWFETRLRKAQNTVGQDRIKWMGSPDTRLRKFEILSGFDLHCLPTTYHEPKGLSVIEAALLGVPSLVPAHGAFPELIQTLGFGELFNPSNPDDLMHKLELAVSTKRPEKHPVADSFAARFGMAHTGTLLDTVIRNIV